MAAIDPLWRSNLYKVETSIPADFFLVHQYAGLVPRVIANATKTRPTTSRGISRDRNAVTPHTPPGGKFFPSATGAPDKRIIRSARDIKQRKLASSAATRSWNKTPRRGRGGASHYGQRDTKEHDARRQVDRAALGAFASTQRPRCASSNVYRGSRKRSSRGTALARASGQSQAKPAPAEQQASVRSVPTLGNCDAISVHCLTCSPDVWSCRGLRLSSIATPSSSARGACGKAPSKCAITV